MGSSAQGPLRIYRLAKYLPALKPHSKDLP
jgi:hypothetical protein